MEFNHPSEGHMGPSLQPRGSVENIDPINHTSLFGDSKSKGKRSNHELVASAGDSSDDEEWLFSHEVTRSGREVQPKLKPTAAAAALKQEKADKEEKRAKRQRRAKTKLERQPPPFFTCT